MNSKVQPAGQAGSPGKTAGVGLEVGGVHNNEDGSWLDLWALNPETRAYHRGYWFMAGTSIVQRALDNRWLTERGVPNPTRQWVEMHYGKQNEQFNPAAVSLTGTA